MGGELLLGLDLGTSAMKAHVYAPDGLLLAHAAEPLVIDAPRPGWAEADPEAWWAAAAGTIRA
ncbi:MAG: FGGY family carbohydrate kinase, partial [Planctomycetota bacterium]